MKMEMTIDTIINDCEQSIKQNELFIKVHQKNMEIGEIKEYQYYIERDKLTMDVMRKYQKIVDIVSLNGEEFKQCGLKELKEILEVIADGKTD